MKILVITTTIPYPPISGATLHTYNLLRRIAEEHKIWLVAFIETDENMEGVEHFQKFCEMIETVNLPLNKALGRPFDFVRYLLSGKPPEFRFYSSQKMRSKIEQLISTLKFDVIQIEHTEMGLYLDTIPVPLRHKTLWHLHDVDWVKFARISRLEPKMSRKLRLWMHSKMLKWWKPRFANQFSYCTTVSEADRQRLLVENPQLNIEVIPGGVDTKEYNLSTTNINNNILLFVGTMSYRPNIDAMVFFCEEILPLIRCQVPDVKMYIVGNNPTPVVRGLHGDGVYVTGKVDDVRPYYKKSAVFVLPLRGGGGAPLKLVEAMAFGRPVVSTTIGSEGREMVVDNKHLLIANTPEAFAEKTVKLLLDKDLRNWLAFNARQLVEKHYDWDVITRRLIEIYSQLAS